MLGSGDGRPRDVEVDLIAALERATARSSSGPWQDERRAQRRDVLVEAPREASVVSYLLLGPSARSDDSRVPRSRPILHPRDELERVAKSANDFVCGFHWPLVSERARAAGRVVAIS